jgi:predicted aminopeptidase
MLQEYFFPKKGGGDDEGGKAGRQATWVKSVDARLKSRRGSSNSLAGDAAAAAAELPPQGAELAAVKIGRPDGTKSAISTPHVASAPGTFAFSLFLCCPPSPC